MEGKGFFRPKKSEESGSAFLGSAGFVSQVRQITVKFPIDCKDKLKLAGLFEIEQPKLPEERKKARQNALAAEKLERPMAGSFLLGFDLPVSFDPGVPHSQQGVKVFDRLNSTRDKIFVTRSEAGQDIRDVFSLELEAFEGPSAALMTGDKRKDRGLEDLWSKRAGHFPECRRSAPAAQIPTARLECIWSFS
jgi:hypothetical protein